MWFTKISLPAAVVAVAAITAVGTGSATGADPASVGQPPPEWAANAGSWPAHNHDLANTRVS